MLADMNAPKSTSVQFGWNDRILTHQPQLQEYPGYPLCNEVQMAHYPFQLQWQWGISSRTCEKKNKVLYSFQKSEDVVDHDLCQRSRRKHACHIHMRQHAED